MPEKPANADGYPPDQVARVKSTCLYLATKLGDLMPELVVVGGLVPSLLIDQEQLPENVTPHVGTLDLDLGLAFALVGEHRYQAVAERLRAARFEMDKNEEGQPTRQRWRISDPPVTVDFLIEPEQNAEAQAGRLFPLSKDWAAIIALDCIWRLKTTRSSRLPVEPSSGKLPRGTSVCAARGRLWFSRRSPSIFAVRTRTLTICITCFEITVAVSRMCQRNSVRCSRMRAR